MDLLPMLGITAMKIEMKGKRFDRWIVLEFAGLKNRAAHWLCRCDCGKELVVSGNSLRMGRSRSCGCIQKEVVAAIGRDNKTHGMTGSKEYNAWLCMIQRCYNPKIEHFKNYGGRGISVCAEWKESFERFLEDMGFAPSDTSTVERKNNNGNYEPSNCAWATRKEQTNNTRANHKITFRGRTMNLCQWAEELGIKQSTLSMRLGAYKWPVERALCTP